MNSIYNFLKKRAIRRAYMIKELKKPESTSDPYEQIFCNDFEERVDQIICSLPLQQQRIMNFSRHQGLSLKEIAQKLNISVRTVENQIYRVNRLLKNSFRSEMKY